MYAIVFPGQGSQRVGMGKSLCDNFVSARDVFSRVRGATGIDVSDLCFESDEETLRLTQNAQIALYTCGLAAWTVLQELLNVTRPSAAAGHSIGEYAALAAAGVISFEDGARLVQKRGSLMAESGKDRPGGMAAVLGLERETLTSVCEKATGGIAVIANDNSPGQLVISGDLDAVQSASALASESGAKRVLPLNVSGAFHSPLMESSSRAMAQALEAAHFADGHFPVYSNVTAETVQKASGWSKLLEQQLKSPVLWSQTIQNMIEEGTSTFVECGSGEVLTGLLRRIDPRAEGIAVMDAVTARAAAEQLARTV